MIFLIFGLTVVIVGLDDAFRLERSDYDTSENIKNISKGQSLFDVHRQYLQTFLIDLQVEVSRFAALLIFSKPSSITIGKLFISYPLVVILHLESFENNLFEFVSLT